MFFTQTQFDENVICIFFFSKEKIEMKVSVISEIEMKKFIFDKWIFSNVILDINNINENEFEGYCIPVK